MTTETTTGAGPGPGPVAPGGGRMDRLALFSAGVPFWVKLTIVWIGIFAVLVFLLSLVDFDWAWIGDNWSYIARGTTYTMILAVGAIVLAVVMALLGALGRLSRNPISFGISGFYTSFFRGTPLIVQLFLIYLALPQIGSAISPRMARTLTLTAVQAGILGLGLNYGAYMTEIFRAGIQSVGHGQGEAADALGMTYPQKMRRVILPQAVRVIIPPTGNEFIAMMKDTALVGFLGVAAQSAEIFRRSQLTGRADFRFLEAFLIAAGIYWLLTTIFSYFQGRLEKRLSKGYVRAAGAPAKTKMLSTGGAGGTGGGGGMVAIPEELEGGAGPAPKAAEKRAAQTPADGNPGAEA